jgi:hypothetical protein
MPAKLHFCWIGPRLPWVYAFAILSAAERSGMPEIILHHTDMLETGAELDALAGVAGVGMRRIDPDICLTETGEALGIGEKLAAIYRGLDSPAARADILRAAILFQQGGIYLDLDTITVSSLLPLLDARQFVGCEHIVWPYFVRASRSPTQWARALTLDLSRKAMRHMADGWQIFRQVQRFYYRGINNAVLGAEPNSPFLAHYLHAMSTMAADRVQRAYALGPDLLQDMVFGDRWSDLVVHDPEVFYPLPPEISEHWFRIRDIVMLDEVLLPKTRVVHWYASVRSGSGIALVDPAYVRALRERQFYSALVYSCISNLPEAT